MAGCQLCACARLSSHKLESLTHLSDQGVQREVILELVVLKGIGAQHATAHGAEVGLAADGDALVDAVIADCICVGGGRENGGGVTSRGGIGFEWHGKHCG